MLSMPSSKKKIAEEMSKTRSQLREKILKKQLPDGVTLTETRTIPEEGRSREWLESEWANLKKLEKSDVYDGRVSGTVYHVSFNSIFWFGCSQLTYGRAEKTSTESSSMR